MSHHRTVVIRAEDASVWRRAQRIAQDAGLPLGHLVTDALREHIARIERQPDTIPADFTAPDICGDIAVEVGAGDGTRWITVFRGSWIVEPDDANRWSPGNDADAAFGVARSPSGALIFYHYHLNNTWAPSLILYPDLAAAARDLDLEDQAVAIISAHHAHNAGFGRSVD